MLELRRGEEDYYKYLGASSRCAGSVPCFVFRDSQGEEAVIRCSGMCGYGDGLCWLTDPGKEGVHE